MGCGSGGCFLEQALSFASHEEAKAAFVAAGAGTTTCGHRLSPDPRQVCFFVESRYDQTSLDPGQTGFTRYARYGWIW